MANALMMRYAASRGSRNDMNGRMAKEDGKYQERGIGNDEHGYPLPYREPRPEFGETEARYRGEDGRYRSGRRRSEMNDREKKWEFTVEPKDEYIDRMEVPSRDTYYPYAPPGPYGREMNYSRRMGEDEYDDPSGRVIGFGAARSHHDDGMMHEKHHMAKGHHKMEEPEELDRETAMEWVKKMKNEDPQKPTGGKFDLPVVKTMARNLGIEEDSPEFWELYAMTNAMYSDYSKVLQKYGVTDPMAYAHLAKAWMHDKDAVEGKTMIYYDCIVKPKMEEGV